MKINPDHVYWEQVFGVALASVAPSRALPASLPDPKNFSKINILSVGKAAASMAQAALGVYGDTKVSGLVVCPEGYEGDCGPLEVWVAGHPVPDAGSVAAAERALAMVHDIRAGEMLLLLVSGGASALLCAPIEGVSFEEKQQVTECLLKSGAAIQEINQVRKALSRVKGGKLLSRAANGCEIHVRLISDVVGDDPKVIGSGLGAYDPVEAEAVNSVLDRYTIRRSFTVPDARFSPPQILTSEIVASGPKMLDAVKNHYCDQGFTVISLGDEVTGEAQEVGKTHANEILKLIEESAERPIAFISGGELTVTVTGDGQGGPNQEYLLSLMLRLPAGRFAGFAADTDGRDGTGGATGAWFSPAKHHQVLSGKTANLALIQNDSFNYFNTIRSLFKVKPSFNNVNDLRVILYNPEGF